MASEFNLTKVLPVIPTFFNESNNVDYDHIIKHIGILYETGIRDIVILGTTSETPTLSFAEKMTIAEIVWNKYSGKMNIVLGISGNNTVEMANEMVDYKQFCNVFMISQPYYNKPSQEGLFQHFKYFLDKFNKRILLYNIPSRCGVSMEPNTIARIYNYAPERVIGIKEASGSVEQVINIKKLCNINIYSGDDLLVLPFMSVGAIGVISVVANIVPSEMINIVNNRNVDDFYRIIDLIKMCFIESNPVPIKYMIKQTYIDSNEKFNDNVRLPLVKLSNDSCNKINAVLANYINS